MSRKEVGVNCRNWDADSGYDETRGVAVELGDGRRGAVSSGEQVRDREEPARWIMKEKITAQLVLAFTEECVPASKGILILIEMNN